MKSGLGRGLGSLITSKPRDHAGSARLESIPARAGEEDIREVQVDLIDPNPHQPRVHFAEEDLQDLVESIRTHGVIQPLVVTKKSGRFELIAGERRLRASKLAGLAKVPVVLRDAKDDQEKLELALIENIQRSDLNPIEEALAYQALLDEYQLTQEEVAKRVGKSRSVVANTVRLLHLPTEIQQALREGKISAGQARALISLPGEEAQLAMYHKIIASGLPARAVEEAVTEQRVTTLRRDPNLMAHENDLREALGTKVRITEKNGKGKIQIDFYSREELLNLKKKLTGFSV
ncbi:MAG: ParB/RepB/Spo0J family partition protein [bacterium]